MPIEPTNLNRLQTHIAALFTSQVTIDSQAARRLLGQLAPGTVTAEQRAKAVARAQIVISAARKRHSQTLSSHTLKARTDFSKHRRDAALKSQIALRQSNLRTSQKVLQEFTQKLKPITKPVRAPFQLIIQSAAKDESEFSVQLQKALGLTSNITLANLGIQVTVLPLPGASKTFILTFPQAEDKLGSERHNVIWALRQAGIFHRVHLASRYAFLYAAPQPDHTLRAERDVAWHLTQLRARQVQLPKPVTPGGKLLGEGVIIAHPDTGWVLHDEYNANQIDQQRAFNVLTGQLGSDAKHSKLLKYKDAPNITHGTATGSLMVGGALPERDGYASNGEQALHFEIKNGKRVYGETQLLAQNRVHLIGIAPKANVLPIKFIPDDIFGNISPQGIRGAGVVRIYDTELIEAIDYAIKARAHVISLSIGGILGEEVRHKLDEAILDHNMIVVAAAGQTYASNILSAISTFLGFVGLGADDSVVEPAAFKNVIAVAGCTPDGCPWDESHRGPNVDITAPADGIWVAELSKVDAVQTPRGMERTEVVECASGTSFATAIMAGVAALWISHWGFDYLVKFYKGVPLAWAFRELLQRTADDREGKWDTSRFGPGITNVEALLNAPLPPAFAIPEPPETARNLVTMTDSLFQSGGDPIEDLWEMAWDLALAGSDAAEGITTGLVQIAQKAADEAVKDARETYEELSAAAESAKGSLQAALEKATAQAGRDLEAVVEASEMLVDQTVKTGEELIDQAADAVEQITTTVGEAAEQVWDWFFG